MKPVISKRAKSPSESIENPSAENHSVGLTAADLEKLKVTFPKDRLGVKVQSYSKDRTRAMLVLYLQHTDVQDRLEEVDPAWNFEILDEQRSGDTVHARARLTIKGVSRENVGEGNDPKAAVSDALKRCAMLFGVGRFLYDAPTVWTEYDDSRDRFRQWNADDYENASRKASFSSKPKAAAKPSGAASPVKANDADAESDDRESLNRTLMDLYRPFMTRYPQAKLPELLKNRYGVAETRLMKTFQLKDLVEFMEKEVRSAA